MFCCNSGFRACSVLLSGVRTELIQSLGMVFVLFCSVLLALALLALAPSKAGEIHRQPWSEWDTDSDQGKGLLD